MILHEMGWMLQQVLHEMLRPSHLHQHCLMLVVLHLDLGEDVGLPPARCYRKA